MVMGFDRQRSNQPQARRLVWKDPHHTGSTSDLLFVPFQHVHRFHSPSMATRQAIDREGRLDAFLAPRTRRVRSVQLDCNRVHPPPCNPRPQCHPRLVGVLVIPDPFQVSPTVRQRLGSGSVACVPLKMHRQRCQSAVVNTFSIARFKPS